MPAFNDPQFWTALVRIIWIDLLLAGDNAVVIALAVRSLPPNQQWWGRIWGTVGAVGLRLIFLFIITFLLQVPLLKFVGGLILIWIAVKLLRPHDEGHGTVRQGGSLMEAVWIIMVADVTMSLDNVLAVAGAAGGNFGLLVFGIMISLPLVVFGSGVIGWMMARWVWIVWVGGGILGFVAGEMMITDRIVRGWLGPTMFDALHWPLPLALFAVLTAMGWWLSRRERGLRAKLASE